MKSHKNYLWGWYYKGSSYHEFRLGFKLILMIKLKNVKATTGKFLIYNERG